ncbi:protein adenylyltransferase SelO [Marinobacter sp. M1N3S26]|uniref:protein adenylyltransferase SelO n=1 Tax=Marinobacter sp. M1N3S26 TaxID=3382299 RepID=UPI00387AAA4A
MTSFDGIKTRPRYLELPDTFFSHVRPTPLRGDVRLVHFNEELAREMGVSVDAPEDWVDIGAGRALMEGMNPVAMKYTGHQFGMYNPDLGDGRGLLLWETEGPDGRIRDWHLKGAGQTPYSRFGDGRAVLRSTIREYLCGEAMHHLGIPSTRGLFLVSATEPVRRETMETAAALVRVADTHIRFGHFEYAAHHLGPEAVRTLADHTIRHHIPGLAALPETERYPAFFAEVVRRTARTIAQWQGVGFCHGVMNSDNMSIIGDTFDYGPYAFLDDFDARYICNHTDQGGRYAYNRQPEIGFINCQFLAHALTPLLDEDDLRRGMREYETTYNETFINLMRRKQGLAKPDENDINLIMDTYSMLHEHGIDYTRFFRGLSTLPSRGPDPVRDLFVDRTVADDWLGRYRTRVASEPQSPEEREAAMCQVNPKYILRNYLAQNVIDAAQAGDDAPLAELLEVLRHPYDEQPEFEHYATLPPDWGKHMDISCSS